MVNNPFYDRALGTATELIDSFGREITLIITEESPLVESVEGGRSIPNPLPWRETIIHHIDDPNTEVIESPLDVKETARKTVTAVFVDPSSLTDLGLSVDMLSSLVVQQDQVCLVKPVNDDGFDVNDVTEIIDGEGITGGNNKWSVKFVRTLRPQSLNLLHIILVGR